MRRPDARWPHAARVALAATAIVAVAALVVVVVANTVVLRRLRADVDHRVRAAATAAASPSGAAPGTGGPSGDVDDAPVFVWKVSPGGSVTALTLGAPDLPTPLWQAGMATGSVGGRTFRYAAVPSGGGWVVAGESIARVDDAGGSLVLVEVLLGALLLLVTFTGSFVVGLRASAPVELVRRRQAEFTADASHELRTPLSVIEAEVDLALARPREAAEYRAVLERVAAESGRLRSIVDDLLWLARADGSAPAGGRDEIVDLSAVVDASVARFTAVADSGGFTLRAHGSAAGPARVRGDAAGIDRLVGVLLDNACRYAGPGGAVDVAVSASVGRVVLTVDDSGPGIPEAHRDLVFDRFHRADDAPGGTGLGLAIADAVVRATSGTWSVDTSPLGGARFQVTWRPAASDVPREPTPAPVPVPGPVAAPRSLS